jgi:hypothetical protein
MTDDEDSQWAQNKDWKDADESTASQALDNLGDYSDEDEEPPREDNDVFTSKPDDKTQGDIFDRLIPFTFNFRFQDNLPQPLTLFMQ